ncbi:MAG: Mur ligase family protein, partial [Gemmatimonadetes bacterium]|nr:Mur ligase family protein [Gemmatimonadota bacterium]
MSVARIVAALEDAGVAVQGVVPEGARVGELRVSGVQQDSRAVGPGDLFVAWAGSSRDAHDYLGAAAAGGARAAIVERPVPETGIPQLRVDNARLAAAVAAGFVAGSPWPGLRTAGVTGTNGKTTTAFLLRGLLGRVARAAAIGTLGVVGPEGRIREDTGLTTPGPVRIAGLISELAGAGVDSVVIETSSHALDQFRLDGVRFDVMAFTNLTRDHLDYHGTFERYIAAKARLLELGREGATAVINADDPAWAALRPPGPVLSYGTGPGADVQALGLRLTARGSRFNLALGGARVPVTLALPGRFNVYNALCAAACALALDQPMEAVATGLADASPVPGRLERIVSEPFDVFVD